MRYAKQRIDLKTDYIACGDNLELIRQLSENNSDLTVTSPAEERLKQDYIV